MNVRRPCRIAIVASHPIQYFVPIYRRLAALPGLRLQVFFCSNFGAESRYDKQFGRMVKWDVELVDGYPHRFLRSVSPISDTFNPLHAINPSVFWRTLGQYDAVWVNGYLYPSNWFAIAAARLGGARVLMRSELRSGHEPHGQLRSGVRRALISYAVRTSDALLYIGRLNRQAYEAFGARPQQLFFCPYSVDAESLARLRAETRDTRDQLRQAWDVPADATVLLYVGKLTERKHPEAMLNVLRDIKDNCNIHVLFVGSGPLEPELRDSARSIDAKRVTFAGFVNQSRIAEAYCLADIFALPSENEPWGLVLNEAMCAELPCVVSNDVGAAHDLIVDGVNGLLFEPLDWAMLAESVLLLANSPSLRQRMGKLAQERASQYCYDASTRGVIDALRSLRIYEG